MDFLNHFQYRRLKSQIKVFRNKVIKKIFLSKIANHKKIQSQKFFDLGINYLEAENLISSLSQIYPQIINKYSSEHQKLFAGLRKIKPKKILEVGTHSGASAFLLQKIFKHSTIFTLDLPDTSSVFDAKRFGRPGRDKPHSHLNFIEERNRILSNARIIFVQMNSFYLYLTKHRFDLIWLDGDHSFPAVAFDFMSCLKILNKDGIMICDDVIENNDVHKCLIFLKETNSLEFELIFKKTDDLSNRFIAICKKLDPKIKNILVDTSISY